MSQFDYQPSYRRNLPHIQPPGSTFFVTFRLAGSLPQNVVRQWNQERQWLAHLARTNTPYYDQVKNDFERAWFAKFESILDAATCGPRWLSDPRIAAAIAESLHYRDRKVYRLDVFTIMPNHVHAVFKPLPTGRTEVAHSRFETVERNARADSVEYHSLATIMHSLKGYTAFGPIRFWVARENSGRTRVTTTGSGMMTSGSA